MMSKEYLGLAV